MIEDCPLATRLPFKLHGFEFISVLGKGAFAWVFKVKHIESQQYYAAKAIAISEDDTQRDILLRKSELNCLMSLYHSNIIKIYDSFEESQCMFMIIELCDGGSIGDMLKKGTKFNENQVLLIMRQLLTAIDYCHSHGIAHRDIKPDNIFVSNEGIVKLGDFGLGVHLKACETSRNFCGSFAYKAPEVIKKIEYCPQKADIWSLGVTFYVIATGSLPWKEPRASMEKMIITGDIYYPMSIPQSALTIIKAMLQVEPSKRPTAKQLLASSSLRSLDTNNASLRTKSVGETLPLCIRSTHRKRPLKRKDSTLTRSAVALLSQRSDDGILYGAQHNMTRLSTKPISSYTPSSPMLSFL